MCCFQLVILLSLVLPFHAGASETWPDTFSQKVRKPSTKQARRAWTFQGAGVGKTTSAKVGALRSSFIVSSAFQIPRSRHFASYSPLYAPRSPERTPRYRLHQLSAIGDSGPVTAPAPAPNRFNLSAPLFMPKKVLVLGASGFVGQKLCATLTSKGVDVVGVSRRGQPETDETEGAAKYISCDAASENDLRKVVKEYGPFDTIVHAVGLLLDSASGLSALNKFASGSGSEPGIDSTYDRVTKQTAFNAIKLAEENEATKTFVFVSAAEAGLDFQLPVPFLENYLAAKREVEARLGESRLRNIIMRPSIIYTWDRPQALASAIPLAVGNAIGFPNVDKPVLVDELVKAAFIAICDISVIGILRYQDIEFLAESARDTAARLQAGEKARLRAAELRAEMEFAKRRARQDERKKLEQEARLKAAKLKEEEDRAYNQRSIALAAVVLALNIALQPWEPLQELGQQTLRQLQSSPQLQQQMQRLEQSQPGLFQQLKVSQQQIQQQLQRLEQLQQQVSQWQPPELSQRQLEQQLKQLQQLQQLQLQVQPQLSQQQSEQLDQLQQNAFQQLKLAQSRINQLQNEVQTKLEQPSLPSAPALPQLFAQSPPVVISKDQPRLPAEDTSKAGSKGQSTEDVFATLRKRDQATARSARYAEVVSHTSFDAISISGAAVLGLLAGTGLLLTVLYFSGSGSTVDDELLLCRQKS